MSSTLTDKQKKQDDKQIFLIWMTSKLPAFTIFLSFIWKVDHTVNMKMVMKPTMLLSTHT